jgi:hypothetical protein
MDIFELTHKTTGQNIGGVKIDISVVRRGGRVWSIEEAGGLIITGQVKFLYDGKVVTDLAVLPEVADG